MTCAPFDGPSIRRCWRFRMSYPNQRWDNKLHPLRPRIQKKSERRVCALFCAVLFSVMSDSFAFSDVPCRCKCHASGCFVLFLENAGSVSLAPCARYMKIATSIYIYLSLRCIRSMCVYVRDAQSMIASEVVGIRLYMICLVLPPTLRVLLRSISVRRRVFRAQALRARPQLLSTNSDGC